MALQDDSSSGVSIQLIRQKSCKDHEPPVRTAALHQFVITQGSVVSHDGTPWEPSSDHGMIISQSVSQLVNVEVAPWELKVRPTKKSPKP